MLVGMDKGLWYFTSFIFKHYLQSDIDVFLICSLFCDICNQPMQRQNKKGRRGGLFLFLSLSYIICCQLR